jgi:hypothetical protein
VIFIHQKAQKIGIVDLISPCSHGSKISLQFNFFLIISRQNPIRNKKTYEIFVLIKNEIKGEKNEI